MPRRMKREEVETDGFSMTAYEQDPDRYSICEKPEDDICGMDGGFALYMFRQVPINALENMQPAIRST